MPALQPGEQGREGHPGEHQREGGGEPEGNGQDVSAAAAHGAGRKSNFSSCVKITIDNFIYPFPLSIGGSFKRTVNKLKLSVNHFETLYPGL